MSQMGKGLARPSGKHVVLTLVENQPGDRAFGLVGHRGPGQRGQGWRCHSGRASARACQSPAPCQLASPRNTRCFCSRRPRKQLDWETAPRFKEPVTRGSEGWVSRSPRCFWGGVTHGTSTHLGGGGGRSLDTSGPCFVYSEGPNEQSPT